MGEGGGWVGGQFLQSKICIISLPALGALRTGALLAVINDEVMIMVYHKGYGAVYTVLCSCSSSSSSSSRRRLRRRRRHRRRHIIVVVVVVLVVVVVVVAVALQRQCNNIYVTNERFFLLC